MSNNMDFTAVIVRKSMIFQSIYHYSKLLSKEGHRPDTALQHNFNFRLIARWPGYSILGEWISTVEAIERQVMSPSSLHPAINELCNNFDSFFCSTTKKIRKSKQHLVDNLRAHSLDPTAITKREVAKVWKKWLVPRGSQSVINHGSIP